jgi:tetratricopeptide (TPR) repeat protein
MLSCSVALTLATEVFFGGLKGRWIMSESENNLAAIRWLLLDAFTEQPGALRTFCQDRPLFKPILPYLGHKYDLHESISAVIDYCKLNVLLDELEAAIRAYKPPEYRRVAEDYAPPSPPVPDEIPEPGRLPPGSRLPFGRNALFTGREQCIKGLAKTLLHGNSGSSPVPQALLGMGGVGKTQLAVEFAYRYGRYFHGVHWLACAEPEAISAEVAACGEEMELESWPNNLPDQIQRTVEAWSEEGRCHLVILDNLEDPAAARQWLLRLTTTGASLVLTARRRRWPRDLALEPLLLEAFSPAESRGFLRNYLAKERASGEDLDVLATRLGRLPLALELTGRYLMELETLSVEGYLDKMGEVLAHQSMRGWEESLGSPTGHDLDLAQTFALSWEQVAEEDARRLFRVAGYCAPNQPIPCELLAAALEFDEEACALALGRLRGLGLLELADPNAGPTIHPLLAEFARTLPQNGGDESWDPLPALASSLGDLAYEALTSRLPQRFAPLRSHLETAAVAAEQAVLVQAGGLWSYLGSHLDQIADYDSARRAYERALTIGEAALGPDHPNVASDLNNLGDVLRSLGRLEAARTQFERALEIWKASYGDSDPKCALAHNSLGLVLGDLGELEASRVHFERALAIKEAAFGPDHPEIAANLNNLGGLLQSLADLAGARQVFERVLGILTTALIWRAHVRCLSGY